MDNESTSFDADLDAILNAGASAPDSQGTPQATPVANPSTPAKYKAAGREWEGEELAKSHDSLSREYSKLKNELKGLSGYKGFDAYLEKNPELRETLSKAINEYRVAKESGASTAQARREAGLPREVAERLDDMQAKLDDTLLEKEINQVQKKYNLSDADMGAVITFSRGNGGISLDHAYKLSNFDRVTSKEAVAAKAEAARQAGRKANVGPSSVSPVAPNPNQPSKMNNEQHQARLSKRLDEYGFKD